MDNIFMQNDNIGILGGTFNPVHCGHLNMANVALESGLVSCVAFLPLAVAPHKNNSYIADKEDRYNMLVLATKDNSKFSVWRYEIDRRGYTYTIDTLRIITKKYPDKRFVYIVGTDTLFNLCKWKDSREVFNLCDFLVIYRPGSDLEAVKSKLEEYKRVYNAHIDIIKDEGYRAESSTIRVALSNGDDTENLLPAEVYKYIQKHGLYGVKNE